MKHRKSPRKSGYNYSSPGGYFITICTKDRVHYFGEVIEGRMVLNGLGRHVTDHRKQISTHYPFVVCDEFMCMPNHIHGILIIGERTHDDNVGTQFFASSGGSQKGTYKHTSLRGGIHPPSGSLGSIIRGFKIGGTKYANHHHIPFARQERYHDRIIITTAEYERMSHYIQTNPEHREDDDFLGINS